jgi:aminoglycoside phosphotransferase (APT) family kinase protein
LLSTKGFAVHIAGKGSARVLLDRPVPQRIEDLTPAWLEPVLALGPLSAVRVHPFGIGNVAETVRIHAEWEQPAAQPETFVAKLASSDAVTRRSADKWRSYEVEANFYRELAPGLTARLPHCYWAGYDAETGACAIVLEDVLGAASGDQIAGCGPAEAALALAELAGVAGPRWGDPVLEQLDWFDRYPPGTADALADRLRGVLPSFLQRYSGRLSADVERLVVRFVHSADRYDRKGHAGPRTICHGDFRNDNLLFGPDRVCIVDWQGAHLGAGLHDVGYLLGTGVPTEIRRNHEVDLVRSYWERLRAFGVPIDWETCWQEYRRHAFGGLAVALLSAAITLSPRTDQLLLTMAERAGWTALDLESEGLLGSPAP